MAEKPQPTRIPFWRLIFDNTPLTDSILNHVYPGSGTEDDPHVVAWVPGDPRNPMNFSKGMKWYITLMVSFATLTVSLVSSAYSGGIGQVVHEFGVSEEVAILGVSLFVLGFAIGPLIMSPLSEVFGRRNVFSVSFALLTAFNAGAAGSQNIQTLIILRFFAGSFGSSPFGNSGGVIADIYPAAQRGIAISLYASSAFLGPSIGPIIGGFLGSGAGWRWVEGFLAAFSGVVWLGLVFFLPETYAPVLLRRRAEKLSKLHGKVYRSQLDIDRGRVPLTRILATALSRPWILLVREPIVLLFTIYLSIIYGTLYMLFAAYPIVFQEVRGWSEGIGGLAFLGILVGMLCGVIYTFPENYRYARKCNETTGRLEPEVRLPPSMVGAVALPVGLFWFAWTNYPSIHWLACIAGTVPFGFGIVLVFLSVFNYLIDSYTIYSASVLAANSAMRSSFGAAFPLFTTYMYHGIGIHWASSIPAFLALLCVPFPFVCYRYGANIRKRCFYAAEAEAFMQRLTERVQEPEPEGEGDSGAETGPEKQSNMDATWDLSDDSGSLSELPSRTSFNRYASRASRRSATSRGSAVQYEDNPFDVYPVPTQSAVEGQGRIEHEHEHENP